MVAEWIQGLLVLENRDMRLDAVRRQLEDAPRELAANQAKSAALRESISAAEANIKSMEARRKGMEVEVAQIEEAIRRFKTQQLLVKKNEEYAALEAEIQHAHDKISALEDEQLALMDDMDAAVAALAELRAQVERDIATIEHHNSQLRQAHAAAEAALEEAAAAVKSCEAQVDAALLAQYRYVRSQVKRPPVVVPLEAGRCQGCHLRVSGEVESMVRRAHELARCDNCGRILYWP